MPKHRRTFPDNVGPRFALQCRTTEALRARLQASADASGRSLSQEMEFRLERSLEREDMRTVFREEFARYRAEREPTLPNMRREDLDEWLTH